MHARLRGFLVALTFSLCLIALPRPGPSACTSLKSPLYGRADSIGLLHDASLSPGIIDRAIGLWQSCRNYAAGFPSFSNGREGSTRTIRIRYVHGSFGGRRCGAFKGNVITLYGFAVDEEGRRRPCGPTEQNLAHELGHVLGLSDAPLRQGCRHHIMASVSHLNYGSRSVTSEECQVAGQRWLTDAETSMLAGRGIGC